MFYVKYVHVHIQAIARAYIQLYILTHVHKTHITRCLDMLYIRSNVNSLITQAKMKKAIFLFNLLFFALVRSIKNLEVKRRKHELTPDYLRRYMKTQYKRRLIYTNINFHNIDNNFNNEIIRKRDFNDSDTISTSLSKIRNIKNIINKYNLKIKREDIDNLKIRTKELVIYKYNFAKKYYILISNKLKDDSSIYIEKFKKFYNISFDYLKDKYINCPFYHFISNISFFNKSTQLPKIISYNSVNILFLFFTLIYFRSDYIYTFFKKKYAFIGEFKNITTDKLVKIHTLSTLLFFFYKLFVLRLLFIANSYNFFSKKLYIVNNLIHFLFFSYISVFPYFLVQANWGSFHLLGSRRSKILGVVVLFQLFSIYIRLFFQNNLSFLRRWTDEYFFNKEEIIKNMREDRKMDFYVNLLNQYGFLKRLYLGNNKIYEVVLHLHKYKYLLDIISPINSFFYIYIAHSIYFYLNNLSFAGIYVSSFSFALLLLKILSNKIDMYFLTKF
ncbi:conserved Plasmodium protein, unknown function [Plasmodium malariae]|uniref:Uncharacterized protein n=1 Tax=Plasmodium malariae TaxID=5858 RepID=A0A1D3JJS4_PLAMA|nr:conserved Plasmodium protein, unknown function [Plasmodium malariae]SBT86642.1 conserved Plasmodium protein, unknown function [Plasmodium malariae]